MSETPDQEKERLAQIGRAVVFYLKGEDDRRALQQATPDNVVEHIGRMAAELRSLENCQALRVGRRALALVDAFKVPQE